MTAVLARILLRYIAAALIAKGIFEPQLGNQLATDPEVARYVEMGIGLAVMGATEGWYWLAKRFGWRT